MLASVVLYDHFLGVMIGRAAVFIFFILSGFWIHRMWTERYALCSQPYLTFMTSRLWRLAPVMLAASAMALAVRLLLIDGDPRTLLADRPVHMIVSHFLVIGYAGLPSPRLLEPAWSLDVEMQFYLVAPLLVLALARFRSAAVVAICAALSLYDTLVGTPSALHLLPWFAMGMLASAHSWRPSREVVLASVIATVGLLLMSPTSTLIATDTSSYDANTRLMWTLAVLAAPVALHTCFVEDSANGRLFGNLSYTLYLVHWPLAIWAPLALPGDPLARILTLVLVVLLSVAVWYGLDRPLQRARASWVEGRLAKGRLCPIVGWPAKAKADIDEIGACVRREP